MSAIEFSVPDEINEAFNTAFAGENKNLIIATLMREAAEQAQRKKQSSAAIARILARRAQAPVLAEAAVAVLRHEGRP